MFFIFRPFGLLWLAVVGSAFGVFAIYFGWCVPHGRGWMAVVLGFVILGVSLALAWSMLRVIASFAWTVLTLGFRRGRI